MLRTDFRQSNNILSVTTPLGAVELLLDSIQGSEALSQLFKFHLTMRATSATLDPSKIVGEKVTVKVAPGDAPVRYFHGIVSRFLHAGGNTAFTF